MGCVYIRGCFAGNAGLFAQRSCNTALHSPRSNTAPYIYTSHIGFAPYIYTSHIGFAMHSPQAVPYSKSYMGCVYIRGKSYMGCVYIRGCVASGGMQGCVAAIQGRGLFCADLGLICRNMGFSFAANKQNMGLF